LSKPLEGMSALRHYKFSSRLSLFDQMIGRIEIRPRTDSMYHHEMDIGEYQSTNGIPLFGFGGHVT